VAGSYPRKSPDCIAKEVAMHTEETAIDGTNARPTGTPALTAIVPLARAGSSTPRSDSIALPVVGTSQDERALSVGYELDVVTHRWVASIVDERSGEVIRTVPSTQVLHQLAALRRPSLDLHA
jgi:hypothetical protein